MTTPEKNSLRGEPILLTLFTNTTKLTKPALAHCQIGIYQRYSEFAIILNVKKYKLLYINERFVLKYSKTLVLCHFRPPLYISLSYDLVGGTQLSLLHQLLVSIAIFISIEYFSLVRDWRPLISICSCVCLCEFVCLASIANIGGRKALKSLNELAMFGTFGC